MAFYDSTYEDESQEKDLGFQKVAEEQEQKDDQQIQQVTSGGEISPVSGGQASQQTGERSTFQNLKKYVEKNQPQAQQMGQKVADDIAKSYKETQQDITKTSTMAQQQVQPDKERYTAAKEGKLANIASKQNVTDQDAQYYQQFLKPEATDYTQNENYALGAERVADLQKRAEEEQVKLQKAGTEEGRFGALQRMIEAPNYTKGQQKLDQLLLSNVGDDIVSNIQQQTGVEDVRQADLVGKLAAEREKAEGIYSDVYGEEGLKAQTQQIASEQLAEREQALQEQLESRKLSNEGLLKRYNEGTLTPQDYATLGLTQGQDIYGLDVGNYLQDPTISQVATQEDLARANALAKLAGVDQTLIADPNVVDDVGLLNQQQLAQDVEKRRSDMTDVIKQLKMYDYFAGLSNPEKQGYTSLEGLEGKELANALYKNFKEPIPWYVDVLGRRLGYDAHAARREGMKKIDELYNQYGGTSINKVDDQAIQEMERARTNNITTGGETSIQQPAFSFNHNTGTIEALPVVSGTPIPQGMSYSDRQKYIEQGRIDPTTNKWIR